MVTGQRIAFVLDVDAARNQQVIAQDFSIVWLRLIRVGPWRDMLERYGQLNAVYMRFRRAAERGVWLSD